MKKALDKQVTLDRIKTALNDKPIAPEDVDRFVEKLKNFGYKPIKRSHGQWSIWKKLKGKDGVFRDQYLGIWQIENDGFVGFTSNLDESNQVFEQKTFINNLWLAFLVLDPKRTV
jgi:hypothetical protein